MGPSRFRPVPAIVIIAGNLAIAAATFPIASAQQATPPPTGRGATADQGRGRAQLQTAPLVSTGVIVGRVIDAGSGEPVAGATVSLNGGAPRSAPTTPASGAGAAPRPMAPPPPPRVLTDSQGRFAFRQLTRGNYSLTAEKVGYASGAYGRTRPNGPTRTLQLDDNERMPDVSLRLFKFAAIAGRVVDEAGEPVVAASVRTFRRTWLSGQRVLQQTSQSQTDDRGFYRVHSLVPGEYIVSVPVTSTTSSGGTVSADARQNFSMTQQGLTGPTPLMAGGVPVPGNKFFWQPGGTGLAPIVSGADGRWRAYATQYYPMARVTTQAEPIVLGSGEERLGVDFAMTFVPTSTISGLIVGSPKPASNWVLRLIPAVTGEFTQEYEIATAVSDGGGAFMFAGIPAGSYVIQTVRVPPNVPPTPPVPVVPPGGRGVAGGAPGPGGYQAVMTTPEPLLWGLTPVTVGDADIAGVGVAVREGLTISGRLEFSGSRPKPDAQRLQQIPIVIEPANGRESNSFSGPPSRTQSDGRFTSAPRLPGRYYIRVGGAPAGYIVQSISAGGGDATERPIELTSQSVSNVVITFSDQIGSIRGTMRDSSPNADPATVVMYPADPAGWKEFGFNPTRIRQQRAGPTGEFNFASLPGGDYFVVGIKDEYASEWQNPAYLEMLSRVAQRVALSPGEQRVLDLQVQDVKPPGIGREPLMTGRPVSEPRVFRPGDASQIDAHESHSGPFVPEQQTPVRDTRSVDPVGSGSISGRVVENDGSKRPLRLARVSVRGGGLAGERLALTTDDGRFTVAGLPAGDYQVTVSKPAYLTMSHGGTLAAPNIGSTIKLAAGAAVINIDLALTRGGVISGVVMDPTGQPAPQVQVQVMMYTQRDGERWMIGAPVGPGVHSTDDRGAYRIYGLRPGKYFVLVRPPGSAGNLDLRAISDDEMRAVIAEASKGPVSPASPTMRTLLAAPPDAPVSTFTAPGRPVTLAPVLYPGVVNEREAGELSIGPGQELTGINFQLQHVPSSRVSGVVIGVDGQPARNARVTLAPAQGGSTPTVPVRSQEGAFEAVGVPPGTYKLIAQVPNDTPGPPIGPADALRPLPSRIQTMHFAAIDLDLFGSDAVNLTLNAAPPLTVSGRVVFEGAGGQAPDFKQVSVRLDLVGRPAAATPSPPPATLDATGAFTITNVMPGRYRLTASAPPVITGGQMTSTWTVIGSSVAGQDSFLTPIEMRDRSLSEAVVTMTSQPPEISGKLVDARGEPVPDLFVVLFPTDPSLWQLTGSRVMRPAVRSLADGTYRFAGLPPREYFLAVLLEFDQTEWGSHAYMEQIAASAIKVSIGRGEKKVQDIKLAGR